MRPVCRKCNIRLSGKVRYNFTTCPNCGKRWELTDDQSAIKTTVLKVQNGKHGVNSVFEGEIRNG
jgi:hypothetical protein